MIKSPSALVKGVAYLITYPNKMQRVGEYSGKEGNAHCFTMCDGSITTIPEDGFQYWAVELF